MVSSPLLVAVAPTKPAAPYLGGKRRLAARIIPALQAMPHRTYVEPFVGMGGIFLRRPWRSPAEVINDLNTDVANLFRILQRHFQPFMDTLKWQITSRAEFERLVAAKADTLTDLERAARFVYLQRVAFGGKIVGQNFGVSIGTPSRFDVTRLATILEHIHERLAGVVVERLPYGALIDRYDREDTLFYLDPPYWGCEDDYGQEAFSRADFAQLAEQLARIRGAFMLSLNDTPGVRECFAGFDLEPVQTGYTISQNRAPVGELLITRRPPQRASVKRRLGKP
jgi:DNA adenine methylase